MDCPICRTCNIPVGFQEHLNACAAKQDKKFGKLWDTLRSVATRFQSDDIEENHENRRYGRGVRVFLTYTEFNRIQEVLDKTRG